MAIKLKPNYYWLSLLFVLFTSTVLAQNSSIKGIVYDDANNKQLEYASVVLLNASDSSNVAFTFTEPNGSFEFKEVPYGNYVVQVFYTGYELFGKTLTTSAAHTGDLGQIRLKASSMTLSTAFIEAKAIPVVIKDDTIVYNPNAFKTKNNATVEDLLKKLPGVRVDKDGKVIAQGQEVTKVLVNGKEFFGTDPTKATQNLDAETIEKVEVLDKKSDDAEFTGVDDGNREKVINLVTKKDANKGYFGKLEAGGGTEETYRVKGTINYFKDETQLTAIGNVNNLNQNGFNWQEYYRMLNGSNGVSFGPRTYWYSQNQWLGQNQQGRQTNAVLGTNANVKVGKSGTINASYFVMGRENDLRTTTTSEDYLPGQVILSDNSYNAVTSNGQHKGVMKYVLKPDTLNWFELGVEADFSNGEDNGFGLTSNRDQEGEFLNTSMSKTQVTKRNSNIKSQLTYRRKLKGTKHSYVLYTGIEHNEAGDTSQWVSDYSLNEVPYSDDIPFTFVDRTSGTGDILFGRVGINLGFDSNQYVSWSADTKRTLGTYNMERNDLVLDSLYTGQSPYIGTRYQVSKTSVRYTKNNRKKNGWYYNIGLGVYNIDIDRELTKADSQRFQKNYWMPLGHFYFGYHSKGKRFGTWFNSNERLPNTNQINPVADVRNPIRISQGSLALDPYVMYNWGVNYNQQNRTKNRYFTANIWTSYGPNVVLTNTMRDENNLSMITYSNDKYSSSMNFNTYYSFLIEKLGLEMGVDFGVSDYTYFSILNGTTYKNQNQSAETGVDLTLELDNVELYTEYAIAYSQQRAGFTLENPNYWTHNFNAEVVFDITDRIQFSGEYDLYYFNSQQVGQKQLVPLLNSEISVELDTNSRWTIGVTGFDMLNKFQSIDRNFTATRYSETRQNTVTRFFMLNLKYSIRKGKKKQQRRNGWYD
jgi:hypothetical protein